jgi:hypothetical protein
VGDTVIAVDSQACDDFRLEQVMDTIGEASSPVQLTLRRAPGTVSVVFSQNGVAVAALPGTPICNLALDANVQILYSCKNGGCGTREHAMVSQEDASGRYVRPCVAKVPKGSKRIVIVPSDRYEPPTLKVTG